MKYLRSEPFTVGGASRRYSENWESTFGRKASEEEGADGNTVPAPPIRSHLWKCETEGCGTIMATDVPTRLDGKPISCPVCDGAMAANANIDASLLNLAGDRS